MGGQLKKDYISGLADLVDLVVVGGRRDAKVVQTLGLAICRGRRSFWHALTTRTKYVALAPDRLFALSS